MWVYVRDDRPFGAADPPAALFHFSPDRRGEHPQAHLANWTGVLQANAYRGYGQLYGGERKPAPIIEAACWAHARRKFFELFAIEREVNGRPTDERLAVRSQRSAPIVAALEGWMRAERVRLPPDWPTSRLAENRKRRSRVPRRRGTDVRMVDRHRFMLSFDLRSMTVKAGMPLAVGC